MKFAKWNLPNEIRQMKFAQWNSPNKLLYIVGSFPEIYRSAPIFGLLNSSVEKMGWAKIWVTFLVDFLSQLIWSPCCRCQYHVTEIWLCSKSVHKRRDWKDFDWYKCISTSRTAF
jgi:hypothetical protein